MTADVQLLDQNPYSQQDLTELGALLANTGYTTLEARALMALVQQASQQVALNVTPGLLEQVRRIQEARLLEIIQRIRSLPALAGYVHRDQIIAIIQTTATKTPRQ
jgi:DNA polymerase III delta subunit